MTNGITFTDFMAGPGGRICEILELSAISWTDLIHVAAQHSKLVDRARRLDGKASSGERAVLHALLAAADFAWLADELGAGETWQRIERLELSHRLAVAAVAARLP